MLSLYLVIIYHSSVEHAKIQPDSFNYHILITILATEKISSPYLRRKLYRNFKNMPNNALFLFAHYN